MRAKLLKKLRRRGRNKINILSTTTTEQFGFKEITGMSIGINDPAYRFLFNVGDTEEDVYKKAERIYIKQYLKNNKP